MALPQTKEQIERIHALFATNGTGIFDIFMRRPSIFRRDRAWWYWHHRAERLRRQGKDDFFPFRRQSGAYGSRKRRRLSASPNV